MIDREALLADIDTWRRWNEGTVFDENYPTSSEASAAHSRVLDAIPSLLAENERLTRRLHPGQGEEYANEVERQRVVIDGLKSAAEGYKSELAEVRAKLAAAWASIKAISAAHARLIDGCDCECPASERFDSDMGDALDGAALASPAPTDQPSDEGPPTD